MILTFPGGILGLICAVIGMLVCGSTYEGGLSNFYKNTSQDHSILAGLAAGILVSTTISIAVSWKTLTPGKKHSEKSNIEVNQVQAHAVNSDAIKENDDTDESDLEWEKTMTIDNPLNPYQDLYKDQLSRKGITRDILTSKHLSKLFTRAKILSGICAAVSFTIFIVVIPSFALSQTVLSQTQMEVWISVCQHWCLIGTVLVVVIPPVQEGLQIWRQYSANKQRGEDRIACTSTVAEQSL